MAWNVYKIDSSKIGFYQKFLIYCDKFDNKIIYRSRAYIGPPWFDFEIEFPLIFQNSLRILWGVNKIHNASNP